VKNNVINVSYSAARLKRPYPSKGAVSSVILLAVWVAVIVGVTPPISGVSLFWLSMATVWVFYLLWRDYQRGELFSMGRHLQVQSQTLEFGQVLEIGPIRNSNFLKLVVNLSATNLFPAIRRVGIGGVGFKPCDILFLHVGLKPTAGVTTWRKVVAQTDAEKSVSVDMPLSGLNDFCVTVKPLLPRDGRTRLKINFRLVA
jgi:hypothetical protein